MSERKSELRNRRKLKLYVKKINKKVKFCRESEVDQLLLNEVLLALN